MVSQYRDQIIDTGKICDADFRRRYLYRQAIPSGGTCIFAVRPQMTQFSRAHRQKLSSHVKIEGPNPEENLGRNVEATGYRIFLVRTTRLASPRRSNLMNP